MLGGMLGAIYVAAVPPVYRARAQIYVPSSSDGAMAQLLLGASTSTPFTNLVGVFQSDTLVDSISAQLNMQPQEFKRTWGIIARSDVSQIDVLGESTSKEMAVKRVDASLEFVRNLDRRLAGSINSAKVGQLERTQKTKEAEFTQSLDTFIDLWSGLDLPLDGTPESLTSFDTIYIDLQSDLRAQEERMRALRAGKERILSTPELPQSDRLEQLRASVASARERLTSVSQQFAKDHPRYVEAKSNLNAAQAIYDREAALSQKTFDANLNAQLVKAETELNGVRAKVESLKKMRRRATTLNAELATARRNMELRAQVLASVRAELDVTRLETEIDRAKWILLTPTYVEERPVNKRYARYPAASAAIGLALGIMLVGLRRGSRP